MRPPRSPPAASRSSPGRARPRRRTSGASSRRCAGQPMVTTLQPRPGPLSRAAAGGPFKPEHYRIDEFVPTEISGSAQDETGVTGVGGFFALLQVQRQPAGVDQHLALLAWDVGAHVTGLRAREQSRIDEFGDMVAPGFLRFRRRLDPAEVVTPHVLDARDD